MRGKKNLDETCFGNQTTKLKDFSADNLDLQDKGINIGSYEIILLKRQK